MVAQSFAGWPHARVGGPVKTEDDPLDSDPPEALRNTLKAIQHLERAVLNTDGIRGTALRYGGFYGPGTSLADGAFQLEGVRKRRFPIVGAGTGITSFIHIDDAATATLAAIERGVQGLYNIVEDEPAPVAEWLPALAEAIGAKPPRRVPGVARSPVRGKARGGHDDGGARGLQRQGQAGARLAAGLPELADRVPSGARQLRGHPGGLRAYSARCRQTSSRALVLGRKKAAHRIQTGANASER